MVQMPMFTIIIFIIKRIEKQRNELLADVLDCLNLNNIDSILHSKYS